MEGFENKGPKRQHHIAGKVWALESNQTGCKSQLRHALAVFPVRSAKFSEFPFVLLTQGTEVDRCPQAWSIRVLATGYQCWQRLTQRPQGMGREGADTLGPVHSLRVMVP